MVTLECLDERVPFCGIFFEILSTLIVKGKEKAAKQLVFGIKSSQIWSNKAESYKKN